MAPPIAPACAPCRPRRGSAALRQANLDYWRKQPDFTATDDASLMEWHGQPVETVPGDILAFKITTPTDLTLARALAEEQHD